MGGYDPSGIFGIKLLALFFFKLCTFVDKLCLRPFLLPSHRKMSIQSL